MKQTNDRSHRVLTSSNTDTLIEKRLKAQGIIYIQNGGFGGRRALNIQIQPDNKLVYQCWKKDRQFEYRFDYLYKEEKGKEFDKMTFGGVDVTHMIKSQLNYMLYCTGVVSSEHRKELPLIPMLFYEKLASIHDAVRKESQYSVLISILAVNEQYIFDLLSETNVELRQINYTKQPQVCEIYFSGAKQAVPGTIYEIYQLVRDSLNIKNTLLSNSYYLIYAELTSKLIKAEKRRILMIDATKDIELRQKNWDNRPLHVLNKCLHGLHKKMENQHKESYCPFREAKITRIMKPFLLNRTRIDIIGFIGHEDDQHDLITLNLVKNLSRIRVSMKQLRKIQNRWKPKQKSEILLKPSLISENKLSKQNPQIQNFEQHEQFPKIQLQQVKQKLCTLKKIKHESFPRLNLFEQVRKNARAEIIVIKRLQQVRQQIKLIKKKKQINSLHFSIEENQSQILENLEEKELELKKKEEQMYMEQSEKINKNRIQTISQSDSQVEKLKLLKQYYTIAMNNQNEQTKQFTKLQQITANFYQDKLNSIQNDLIKSAIQAETINNNRNHQEKKSVSVGKTYQQNLPIIHPKKRVSFLKEIVKKGRVDYSNFLQKNVEQYQTYSIKNSL